MQPCREEILKSVERHGARILYPPGPFGATPLTKGGEEASINLQVKTQRYRLIALSPITQGGMKGGFDIDMGGKYSNLFIPPAPSGPPPLLKGVKKRA